MKDQAMPSQLQSSSPRQADNSSAQNLNSSTAMSKIGSALVTRLNSQESKRSGKEGSRKAQVFEPVQSATELGSLSARKRGSFAQDLRTVVSFTRLKPWSVSHWHINYKIRMKP